MSQKEIETETLAAAGSPQDDGVGDILIMEIQKVRGSVVGFEDGQVFRPEMSVLGLSSLERKEKGEIRIVGIEEPQPAQVVGVVAGQNREPRVQLVVALFNELGVVRGEDFETLGDGALKAGTIAVIEHDRH